MSQSQVDRNQPWAGDGATGGVRRIEDEEAVQTVLELVEDPDCRAILRATSDEALSADELSTRCDLPLSTAYRKLNLLTEAGLVAERTRICRSGAHTQEYGRLVTDVGISLSPAGEVSVRLECRQELAARSPEPAAADD